MVFSVFFACINSDSVIIQLGCWIPDQVRLMHICFNNVTAFHHSLGDPLLTHNREYWNAVSSVCRLSSSSSSYRVIFISLDFWTLIIYKFLKLITSVRVTIQLNL